MIEPRKRSRPIALVALLAVLSAACTSPSTAGPTPSAPLPSAAASTPSAEPAPTTAPSPSLPSSTARPGEPDADALAETTWRLVRLDRVDLPPDAGITADFGPGEVGGSGGCNHYSGTLTVDGTDMAVTDVVSTLMGCEGVVGQREAAYLATLQRVASWSLADDRLTLTDPGGGELLVFEPAA